MSLDALAGTLLALGALALVVRVARRELAPGARRADRVRRPSVLDVVALACGLAGLVLLGVLVVQGLAEVTT